MPRATACPDLAALQRMAASPPSAPELKALLEHLASCEGCVGKLAAIPNRKRLVERLRQIQERKDGATRDFIVRLLDRLNPPGETAATLSFPCPGCAKTLKARAELFGKKLKCPNCKREVVVPAPSANRAEQAEARTIGGQAPGRGNDTLAYEPSSKDREYTEFLSAPQAPDELGRLGPYRVLQVLGAGGMGVVFRAEDPQLQRPVALKAMLPGLGSSSTARQRFLREARAAAGIKHDHIVSIYQVGEDRGAPFLAMEFLEGEPLDARLKREGKLPMAEIVRIGREIAEGLEAAHERGLIHRDIKPANVWLEGKKARVKILDFGLARGGAEDAQLTQTGAIVGTPAYMAPEQAQGQSLDGRCDLFSLGCVLYRMATGRMPFKGNDTISTLLAVATETPPAPQELDASLPPALSALVMRLLEKKAVDRPPSAQAVVAELEAIASAPPPPAPLPEASAPLIEPPAPEPPVQWKSGLRKPRSLPRWLPYAIGGGVLLVIVLISIIVRVTTGQGTLVLETSDDDVQVQVSQGGKRVTLLDGKTKKEISLDAGTYQLELVGGKDGLKLETNQFVLKRGEQQVARVTFEPRRSGAKGLPSDSFLTADLAGWEGLMQYWSYKNGVLTGILPQKLSHNTFLCSKKKYRDFALEFQVRLKGDKGNSGVQIRSEILDRATFTVRGPQADIGSPTWGGLYGEQFGGWMQTPDEKVVAKLIKPDEYNDYYLRCVGKFVLIRVNGQTLINSAFPSMPADGIIAWQLHGGAPMEVNVRNIRFTDFSGSPATSTTDFRPLFNGKDLSGWEVLGTGKWDVLAGILRADGNGTGWLCSTQQFADFELELDYHLPTKGNSGVFLRAFKGARSDGSDLIEVQLLDDAAYPGLEPNRRTGSIYRIAAPNPSPQTPANQWHTLRIHAEGARIRVTVNGVAVTDATVQRSEVAGPIGLQMLGTTVEFRNIRVRELSK